MFLGTGEKFEIVDDYANPIDAHRILANAWVGTSEMREWSPTNSDAVEVGMQGAPAETLTPASADLVWPCSGRGSERRVHVQGPLHALGPRVRQPGNRAEERPIGGPGQLGSGACCGRACAEVGQPSLPRWGDWSQIRAARSSKRIARIGDVSILISDVSVSIQSSHTQSVVGRITCEGECERQTGRSDVQSGRLHAALRQSLILDFGAGRLSKCHHWHLAQVALVRRSRKPKTTINIVHGSGASRLIKLELTAVIVYPA